MGYGRLEQALHSARAVSCALHARAILLTLVFQWQRCGPTQPVAAAAAAGAGAPVPAPPAAPPALRTAASATSALGAPAPLPLMRNVSGVQAPASLRLSSRSGSTSGGAAQARPVPFSVAACFGAPDPSALAYPAAPRRARAASDDPDSKGDDTDGPGAAPASAMGPACDIYGAFCDFLLTTGCRAFVPPWWPPPHVTPASRSSGSGGGSGAPLDSVAGGLSSRTQSMGGPAAVAALARAPSVLAAASPAQHSAPPAPVAGGDSSGMGISSSDVALSTQALLLPALSDALRSALPAVAPEGAPAPSLSDGAALALTLVRCVSIQLAAASHRRCSDPRWPDAFSQQPQAAAPAGSPALPAASDADLASAPHAAFAQWATDLLLDHREDPSGPSSAGSGEATARSLFLAWGVTLRSPFLATKERGFRRLSDILERVRALSLAPGSSTPRVPWAAYLALVPAVRVEAMAARRLDREREEAPRYSRYLQGLLEFASLLRFVREQAEGAAAAAAEATLASAALLPSQPHPQQRFFLSFHGNIGSALLGGSSAGAAALPPMGAEDIARAAAAAIASGASSHVLIGGAEGSSSSREPPSAPWTIEAWVRMPVPGSNSGSGSGTAAGGSATRLRRSSSRATAAGADARPAGLMTPTLLPVPELRRGASAASTAMPALSLDAAMTAAAPQPRAASHPPLPPHHHPSTSSSQPPPPRPALLRARSTPGPPPDEPPQLLPATSVMALSRISSVAAAATVSGGAAGAGAAAVDHGTSASPVMPFRALVVGAKTSLLIEAGQCVDEAAFARAAAETAAAAAAAAAASGGVDRAGPSSAPAGPAHAGDPRRVGLLTVPHSQVRTGIRAALARDASAAPSNSGGSAAAAPPAYAGSPILAWDYVVPPGQWTHLAFVATPAVPALGRSARVSLFVGGEFKGALPVPDGVSLQIPLSTIGSKEGSSFHGDLHEARFWRVARSPLEIRRDLGVQVRMGGEEERSAATSACC